MEIEEQEGAGSLQLTPMILCAARRIAPVRNFLMAGFWSVGDCGIVVSADGTRRFHKPDMKLPNKTLTPDDPG